jgi:mannose-6-phosphate isomerase-like protein (cupin superfamily)
LSDVLEAKQQPINIKSKLGPIKILSDGIQATNWQFGKVEYKDEDYTFKKLEILIGEDIPAYTIGQYVIKGNGHTKWISYSKDALYYVRMGEGWFMIGDSSTTLETGYYVCVPAETRHCILNNNKNMECRVDLIFAGMIKVG